LMAPVRKSAMPICPPALNSLSKLSITIEQSRRVFQNPCQCRRSLPPQRWQD
jgi:hypothetical protein